jgi:hypothetical protein
MGRRIEECRSHNGKSDLWCGPGRHQCAGTTIFERQGFQPGHEKEFFASACRLLLLESDRTWRAKVDAIDLIYGEYMDASRDLSWIKGDAALTAAKKKWDAAGEKLRKEINTLVDELAKRFS